MKNLPLDCPSCGSALEVKQLRCTACDTGVDGLYPLPVLASLPREDQEFVVAFVESSGSLKAMAKMMKVSYPTVRNRLDEIIGRLKQSEKRQRKEGGPP